MNCGLHCSSNTRKPWQCIKCIRQKFMQIPGAERYWTWEKESKCYIPTRPIDVTVSVLVLLDKTGFRSPFGSALPLCQHRGHRVDNWKLITADIQKCSII